MATTLKQHYEKNVVPELMKQLNLGNVHQVPKITKVTLNMGLGQAVNDKKIIEKAVQDMTLISGQKPVVTKVRKSIAGFKIRDGWPIGCKVTLRGDAMYHFLERWLHIALPRVRDFRGLNRKSFDKQGNYSMGVKEQIIFPEIEDYSQDSIRGLDICISITATTGVEQSLPLLLAMNFPFKEA